MKHSKRKNVGLIYEFLVRKISTALVESDKASSARALKILKKHFKQGTELYREFRLVNSLVTTTVSSQAVALSIMSEARTAARSRDVVKLDEERKHLLKSVYRAFGEELFEQHVPNYRAYATAQTLISIWRAGGDADLAEQIDYEDKLVEQLQADKTVHEEPLMESSPGQGRLLMHVMMKKLNDHYAGALTSEQKDILRSYAWSAVKDNNAVNSKLVAVRDSLIGEIDRYLVTAEGIVAEKMKQAREKLSAETLSEVNDDVVTRFMLYSKLREEMKSEE